MTSRQEIRDEFRTKTIEWAAAFDKDEQLILKIEGNEENVTFTAEQERIMREKGVYFTHNHPWLWQTIFSIDDFRFFISHPNCKEFEVITMDGTYILRKTAKIHEAKAENLLGQHEYILGVFQRALKKNAKAIIKMCDDEEITEERADAWLMMLARTESVAAIVAAIRQSNGRIKLDFIPQDEYAKEKFNKDLRNVDFITDKLEQGEIYVELVPREFLLKHVPKHLAYPEKSQEERINVQTEKKK
jgi:hypothetical protein